MFGADATGGSPISTDNEVADALFPGLGSSKNNRVSANVQTIYKFHGLEDLSATISFNGHFYTSRSDNLGRDNTPATWSASMVALGKGGQGKQSYNTSSSYHYNIDYYLNYKHTFAGKHALDLTLGHSYEDDFGKSYTHALCESLPSVLVFSDRTAINTGFCRNLIIGCQFFCLFLKPCQSAGISLCRLNLQVNVCSFLYVKGVVVRVDYDFCADCFIGHCFLSLIEIVND
jgi:hypothetical protein